MLAPRKQNFHQHDLFILHSAIECDADAEPAHRRLYPRLSQALPLVYSGPGAAIGWVAPDEASQGQGGGARGVCPPRGDGRH